MATSCTSLLSDTMTKRCRFCNAKVIAIYRQAIETGFVKPCAMCKGRPRRSGERVCGPVCRERERKALPVQGTYYGVSVARQPRREQTRREPAIPTNRARSPDPIVPVEPTAPTILPSPSIVSIVPTAPTVPVVPLLPTAPAYTDM